MLVTRDSLQLYLTTDVSKSFKIDVHITTNYSSNRNDTLFNAMIVFDNGLSKVRFNLPFFHNACNHQKERKH